MKISRLFEYIVPSEFWRLPVIIILGIAVGLLLLILRISNAPSYSSDDPAACMNCHVMTPQFASWQKSSHRQVAVCNDCHVPHDNIINHYFFKAKDGLRHSYVFTFRLEPHLIRIKEATINVVQENCIRCHYDLINTNSIVTVNGEAAKHGEGKLCWDCHQETPHGTVSSLSSFPYAQVPRLSPVIPKWMEEMLIQQNKKKK
jgi:cytochrome c nitrite reductase small subunit